jgi:23S rRNA pseudouridine1911/1915/1917 synthase
MHRAFLSASGRRVRVQQEEFDEAVAVQTEVLTARLRDDGLSRVEVRVHLARRHQVRAHLAFVGHPIAGDALYGGPQLEGLGRHYLHASSIGFRRTADGEMVVVESELPQDLVGV